MLVGARLHRSWLTCGARTRQWDVATHHYRTPASRRRPGRPGSAFDSAALRVRVYRPSALPARGRRPRRTAVASPRRTSSITVCRRLHVPPVRAIQLRQGCRPACGRPDSTTSPGCRPALRARQAIDPCDADALVRLEAQLLALVGVQGLRRPVPRHWTCQPPAAAARASGIALRDAVVQLASGPGPRRAACRRAARSTARALPGAQRADQRRQLDWNR